MNHLQVKLLEQCSRRRLSVEQTFETLKAQRDLCEKMMKHTDEVFARKVWKRSVMVTTNYGGSLMTSRQDVLYQLKAMESTFLYDCTPSELTMFTNMVFWSMEAGVPSAMRFLSFFRKLLTFVLKYKDEVTFRNPLTGFPICLKVYDEEVKGYSYRVHGKSVTARITKKLHTTNRRKTVSSTVPSIIHSQDAAILVMIKTGLETSEMAYIHDSVGVHPNNLLKAKESVTDALVKVLEGDVFQSVVDQLLEGIPEDEIPEELKSAPREDTWKDVNSEDWYYAYS